MMEKVKHDEWNIIEVGFHEQNNMFYESLMSLGNGYMGMRGNFEESFSGDTLQGTYIAGVYYPDKTRVGWWKNGYPEYFAKVLNAVNFIGIDVFINGEKLDLNKCTVKDFTRTLNMQQGYLHRSFIVVDSQNRETKIEAKRFLSLAQKEIGAISYSVTAVNHDTELTLISYLDGNVRNEDSNYDEMFWLNVDSNVDENLGYLTMKTKKLDFHVTAAVRSQIVQNDIIQTVKPEVVASQNFVAHKFNIASPHGTTTTIYKYVAVTNNRYMGNADLASKAIELVEAATIKGFNTLFSAHCDKWKKHWEESDIVIQGDVAAQQAIRFNIFQLTSTYTGEDSRLNIGPKGFTGEKYGGSTYWDTEAYCIPFYLSTADEKVSKNLLVYRYNQLEKAKENARKLGLDGALYPMVTMNGEECHNEWEITFEEIHRNAAIPYAIYNYVRYTGDEKHLAEYGFDVLVETSRFWASRVHYNPFKDKYMMLGVTGPNEYENNVNNNWYTNTMACWNMQYTLEVAELLKEKYSDRYTELVEKLGLKEEQEFAKWKDIISKMYFPYVDSLKIFEQQDGYMDKDQILVKDLPKENLPLNQKWSWDRILRSCFIKQADVLQGIFFLGDRYDLDTKKRNFDFYEPRTVHESSLSPCIYSIIASEIGYKEKAYELYLRTARLDLDNYNNDTEDGLHITSMAGTWMSITYGFGGLRIKDNSLSLNPYIPNGWKEYSFKILFRGHLLRINVTTENIIIEQEKGTDFTIKVFDNDYVVGENSRLIVKA